MKLHAYKTIILVISASLSLLIAAPSMQQLIVFPSNESITELWILGPNHDISYPSNITAGENLR